MLGQQTAMAGDVEFTVVFSDGEISLIRAWYREHGSANNERGGRGRNGLPPGIARNLERGKALPPGIAKRYLPDDLRRSLPAPPDGYERIVVDGRVLLVEIATRVIHDVLTDVILN